MDYFELEKQLYCYYPHARGKKRVRRRLQEQLQNSVEVLLPKLDVEEVLTNYKNTFEKFQSMFCASTYVCVSRSNDMKLFYSSDEGDSIPLYMLMQQSSQLNLTNKSVQICKEESETSNSSDTSLKRKFKNNDTCSQNGKPECFKETPDPRTDSSSRRFDNIAFENVSSGCTKYCRNAFKFDVCIPMKKTKKDATQSKQILVSSPSVVKETDSLVYAVNSNSSAESVINNNCDKYEFKQNKVVPSIEQQYKYTSEKEFNITDIGSDAVYGSISSVLHDTRIPFAEGNCDETSKITSAKNADNNTQNANRSLQEDLNMITAAFEDFVNYIDNTNNDDDAANNGIASDLERGSTPFLSTSNSTQHPDDSCLSNTQTSDTLHQVGNQSPNNATHIQRTPSQAQAKCIPSNGVLNLSTKSKHPTESTDESDENFIQRLIESSGIKFISKENTNISIPEPQIIRDELPKPALHTSSMDGYEGTLKQNTNHKLTQNYFVDNNENNLDLENMPETADAHSSVSDSLQSSSPEMCSRLSASKEDYEDLNNTFEDDEISLDTSYCGSPTTYTDPPNIGDKPQTISQKSVNAVSINNLKRTEAKLSSESRHKSGTLSNDKGSLVSSLTVDNYEWPQMASPNIDLQNFKIPKVSNSAAPQKIGNLAKFEDMEKIVRTVQNVCPLQTLSRTPTAHSATASTAALLPHTSISHLPPEPLLVQLSSNQLLRYSGKALIAYPLTLDIGQLFGVTCLPFLVGLCFTNPSCSLCHNFRDSNTVVNGLRLLCDSDLQEAYNFAYNHRPVFQNYIYAFFQIYTEQRNSVKLLTMIRDCERYPGYTKLLIYIFHGLQQCGLSKDKACQQILSLSRDRSISTIDVLVNIILESNWTVFWDHIKRFADLFDYNFRVGVLNKIAAQVLSTRDPRQFLVFKKCIPVLLNENAGLMRNSLQ